MVRFASSRRARAWASATLGKVPSESMFSLPRIVAEAPALAAAQFNEKIEAAAVTKFVRLGLRLGAVMANCVSMVGRLQVGRTIPTHNSTRPATRCHGTA